jgi:hypothetical protein
MSLNLKTKIQGLECPWICKEVLECPWILLALVFGYFLKLFDIQDGHFVELILHVHIWPHYKVTFWTIQRHILLISNAFYSVFSPWIFWYMALNVLEKSWKVLKSLKSKRYNTWVSCNLISSILFLLWYFVRFWCCRRFVALSALALLVGCFGHTNYNKQKFPFPIDPSIFYVKTSHYIFSEVLFQLSCSAL